MNCVQLLHLHALTCPSQNIKWWGLEKYPDHRRGLCRTLTLALTLISFQQTPCIPGFRSEEGETLKHDGADLTRCQQAPAPALTPVLAQFSGDPAWLTQCDRAQGTLPPPPPSTAQNAARFLGMKTKLQGQSQKLLRKYWHIAAQFRILVII